MRDAAGVRGCKSEQTIISPATSGALWKQWRLTRREEKRPETPPVADSLTPLLKLVLCHILRSLKNRRGELGERYIFCSGEEVPSLCSESRDCMRQQRNGGSLEQFKGFSQKFYSALSCIKSHVASANAIICSSAVDSSIRHSWNVTDLWQ